MITSAGESEQAKPAVLSNGVRASSPNAQSTAIAAEPAAFAKLSNKAVPPGSSSMAMHDQSNLSIHTDNGYITDADRTSASLANGLLSYSPVYGRPGSRSPTSQPSFTSVAVPLSPRLNGKDSTTTVSYSESRSLPPRQRASGSTSPGTSTALHIAPTPVASTSQNVGLPLTSAAAASTNFLRESRRDSHQSGYIPQQYHQSTSTSNGNPYHDVRVAGPHNSHADITQQSYHGSDRERNGVFVHSNSNSTTNSHSTGYQGPNPRLPRPSEIMARELTQVLVHSFIPSILPTPEEYQVKEAARKFLEGLADRVYPGAKLLPFGSQANGMALRNSDMDLCYIGPQGQPPRPASELVEALGALIQEEAPTFKVKMLSRARIPIIKLEIPPTKEAPNGIACDIGFENRLALENTRLLLTYAMADYRLRTLVLFLKVWTKRRKLNNPYLGTLSSYGFVLLVLHYLINVRKPPVLPNLQRLQPTKKSCLDRAEFEGHDVYFFDDLEHLPLYWQSQNRDSVGELLVDFFHYYQKEFRYAFDVVSIRSEGGLLSKHAKGWNSDQVIDADRANVPRDLNRLCIEDPFQINYNVARTVTADGLFTIRGEISRAANILRSRHYEGSTNVNTLIADLVAEREDILMQAPPPSSNRRRSAPSPRLAPTHIPNQQDFRSWALAHGVPHSHQHGAPVYSHNLAATPLTDDANIPPLPNGARLGPVDGQSLSQANLLQLQYQQQLQAGANLAAAQTQQQLLANLPALLATTNLRSSRPLNKRFPDPSHRPPRYSQSPNGTSAYLQPGAPHISYPSMATGSLSRNTIAEHGSAMPQLERRSSWDGMNVSIADDRRQFRSSSSRSDTGRMELTTMTAPTSPNMNGSFLPTGNMRSTLYSHSPNESVGSASLANNSSLFSAESASASVLAGLERVARDQMRMGSYGGPHRTTNRMGMTNGRGRPPRPSYDRSHAVPPALPMPCPRENAELAVEEITRLRTEAEAGSIESAIVDVASEATRSDIPSAQQITEPTSSSPSCVSSSTQEEVKDIQPGAIRFGNFDAAFYSAEPSEMTSLGLYEADSVTDSNMGSPALGSIAPSDKAAIDNINLSSPRMPSTSMAASLPKPDTIRDSLKRGYRLDLPSSNRYPPIPEGDKDVGSSTVRTRRHSAGDEAGLGMKDVTFFGNIPVTTTNGGDTSALTSAVTDSSIRSPKVVRKASRAYSNAAADPTAAADVPSASTSASSALHIGAVAPEAFTAAQPHPVSTSDVSGRPLKGEQPASQDRNGAVGDKRANQTVSVTAASRSPTTGPLAVRPFTGPSYASLAAVSPVKPRSRIGT